MGRGGEQALWRREKARGFSGLGFGSVRGCKIKMRRAGEAILALYYRIIMTGRACWTSPAPRASAPTHGAVGMETREYEDFAQHTTASSCEISFCPCCFAGGGRGEVMERSFVGAGREGNRRGVGGLGREV